jgi:hypothetical protein
MIAVSKQALRTILNNNTADHVYLPDDLATLIYEYIINSDDKEWMAMSRTSRNFIMRLTIDEYADIAKSESLRKMQQKGNALAFDEVDEVEIPGMVDLEEELNRI